MAKKYEYTVAMTNDDGDDIEETLQEYADEDWEYVNGIISRSGNYVYLVFKREL